MALPDSYTAKPGSIPAYFEALLNAEAPERFTQRFLENLEFKSTNDRLLIGVLKELGFLDADGVPQDRYFEFLDRARSARIVADGVREAYSDLFTVNTNAHELPLAEVKNKLRTLYKGAKKDAVLGRIASTFVALCEYADFSSPASSGAAETPVEEPADLNEEKAAETPRTEAEAEPVRRRPPASTNARDEPVIGLDSLQYHINIVLPESRDQAVYDAIFKSLRDHLGAK